MYKSLISICFTFNFTNPISTSRLMATFGPMRISLSAGDDDDNDDGWFIVSLVVVVDELLLFRYSSMLCCCQIFQNVKTKPYKEVMRKSVSSYTSFPYPSSKKYFAYIRSLVVHMIWQKRRLKEQVKPSFVLLRQQCSRYRLFFHPIHAMPSTHSNPKRSCFCYPLVVVHKLR